jgi:hypothetical protein
VTCVNRWALVCLLLALAGCSSDVSKAPADSSASSPDADPAAYATVPDFALGSSTSQVRRKLRSAGLATRFEGTTEALSQVVVADVNPVTGTRVPIGSTVTVTFDVRPILPAVDLAASWNAEQPAQRRSGERLRVRTHCGIQAAWVQGRLWLASPPINRDMESHLGFNSTVGRFRVVDEDRATFIATSGLVAHFRTAPPGTLNPNRGCF